MDVQSELDKELASCIMKLSTRQKEAVLTVAKTFIETEDWDENFSRELDRRTKEYEMGNAQLLTLNEIEETARYAYKNK